MTLVLKPPAALSWPEGKRSDFLAGSIEGPGRVLTRTRDAWSPVVVREGTFKLRIVCSLCKEVVMEDGDSVWSATKHRSLVTSAVVRCPVCKEPFVEVCVRNDGSSLARCARRHVHGVKARAEEERRKPPYR